MSSSWPELCLQALTEGDWWEEEKSGALRPGLLVEAILPHVDFMPYRLDAVGRTEAHEHTEFQAKISPVSTRADRARRTLPVAGLPEIKGETWTVHRAKRRPALVLTAPGAPIPKDILRRCVKWQVSKTALVAPFYGIKNERRAGWDDELVSRIQTIEYPQYAWDCLPKGGPEGSVLRLDHIQPIGEHQYSYEPTGYALASKPLALLWEQIQWLKSGHPVPPEGELQLIRDCLMDEAKA